jgi:hypothetical protein
VSDDEEEDSFLRVVGDESKLLRGEAYQKCCWSESDNNVPMMA